ncbi:MAG: single-stranded DNA-binding protein [Candidatus Peribacteraceae bacterium]
MFSLNRVDLVGYQTQPLTPRQTPGGTRVVDMNLVVPYSFQSGKGEMLSGKSFHTVTLWGAMADFASQYVRPGSQVFVSGRLQTDSWEDTESKEKRSKTKLVALDLILLDPKDGQREAPSDARLTAGSVNHAQVIGNVTRDPEMRTTTSGQSVLTIGVATNERWKDRASNEMKERTEYHNVVIWGELAQEVQRTIHKGSRVHVAGRVQTRSWETKEGQKRTTTEIVADTVTLLGIKSREVAGNIKTDGAPVSHESHEEAPSPVGVGASAPSVSYESDVKPEDLPF